MPTGGTQVQIVGLKRLRSTMRKAGVDMTQFKEVNTKVAGSVATIAKGRTPFDPGDGKHLFTTVRPGATQAAAVIRAGNNTTVPYANPIHWGWFRRNIKPNPWISRTAQETEPAWTQIYWDNLNKILDQIDGA